jgi:hypothetical protein
MTYADWQAREPLHLECAFLAGKFATWEAAEREADEVYGDCRIEFEQRGNLIVLWVWD